MDGVAGARASSQFSQQQDARVSGKSECGEVIPEF